MKRATERDVLAFIEHKAVAHHELAKPPVLWRDVLSIARREGVQVQLVPLSRPARLLRYGEHVYIQLSRALDATARARYGVHELVHFWRDDIGEPCYYADNDWLDSPSEDFAELVSWIVTYSGPLPF